MSKLKLEIELVPKPLWGVNLHSRLPKTQWTKIRAAAIAKHEGLVCEICGATGKDGEGRKFHAHERRSYDENVKAGVARLLGVGVICSLCHAVHHIGRTRLIAADDPKYSG